MRVAPLLVLLHGERQRRVEHGVEHVDEGHLDEGRVEELGAEVEHRAHQEPTCAPTGDGELAGRGVALGHEQLPAGDEVREGGALVRQPPLVVPAVSVLAAAAHVREGQHDAAVEQREGVALEAGLQRVAVCAVGLEQQRCGQRHALLPRHGDGDARAVGGGGEAPQRLVARGLETSDLLLPAHGHRSADEIELEDRERSRR
jgi:hypothetical protein